MYKRCSNNEVRLMMLSTLGSNVASTCGVLIHVHGLINSIKPIILFMGHRQLAQDVTSQNVASHLGLFCLLSENSSKNE